MSLDTSKVEMPTGLALGHPHPFPFQHFLWPHSVELPSATYEGKAAAQIMDSGSPLSIQMPPLPERQRIVKSSSLMAFPP